MATRWLAGTCKLSAATIDYFGFGLDARYESGSKGTISSDALTFPRRDRDGIQLSTTLKADIPDVTRGAKAKWWSTGAPATFYCGGGPGNGGDGVVVCDMIDAWFVWQEIQAGGGGLEVIASTAVDALPAEWSSTEFWTWRAVYVATPRGPRGDRMANVVQRSAGRAVRRAYPSSQTWQEAEARGAEFSASLRAAPKLDPDRLTDEGSREGHASFEPLDVGRACHEGRLYYAVRLLVSENDPSDGGDGRRLERLDTAVLRSDGKLLRAHRVPAPPGTPAHLRVFRLTDGTVVDGPPPAPANQSWSWPSIKAWLAAKRQGDDLRLRPISEIVAEMAQVVRKSVWLPNEQDYVLLALTAATSYSQAIFQSAPMVLICGGVATGKSAAALAVGALSANGTVVRQVRPATVARVIHETNGLVVIDGLDAIGLRKGGDPEAFRELVRWLKLSQNRETAGWASVDEGQTASIRSLNGFGVKVVTFASGNDAILPTATARVQTCKMPLRQGAGRPALAPFHAGDCQRLRDELHVWTAENVAAVASAYHELCSVDEGRLEDNATPLRVLAHLSGPGHVAELEAALSGKLPDTPADPAAILTRAAEILVRQGYREVSPTHAALEARRLIRDGSVALDVPELAQPEWVGRSLRASHVISGGEAGYRRRLRGANLRIYPLDRDFVASVLAQLPPPALRDAADFCTDDCGGCAYADLGCQMRS